MEDGYEPLMAIIVHAPDDERSVAILDCNNIQDLGLHESKNLQKLATTHIFFQKMLAYIDTMLSGAVSREEVTVHMQDFFESYRTSVLDFDHDDTDELEKLVHDNMMSDEFTDKYMIFMQLISSEVFKIFASGAISYEEGDVEIGTVPAYLRHPITTQA